MIARYRRSGADPPFRDPAGHHGVPMEGYYWRLADAATGTSVVAICGTLQGRSGAPRALVALGAGAGPATWRWAEPLEAHPGRVGVRAGAALRATPDRLEVDLGPGARLRADLAPRPWPRRALGALAVGHLVPRLGQYWHPHALGGTARAELELPGAPARLVDAALYAEKNWGRAFPPRWWWGQAGTWAAGDDAVAAFAGGLLLRRGPAVASTAVVLRVEERMVRLVAPFALVRVQAGGGEWRLRGRGPRERITVEGDAGAAPLALPVPPAAGHGPLGEVAQHQAGRMRVSWRSGRRTAWRGESALAALEAGSL